MTKGKVGIISDGIKGDALGYHFASNGYNVLMIELRDFNRSSRMDPSCKEQKIKIKKINGKLVEVGVNPLMMKWTSNIEDLSKSDLLIVATSDDEEGIRRRVSELENATAAWNTPIIVESMNLLPGTVGKWMKDNTRLLVAYFYDVDYANNNVELITHEHVSAETLNYVQNYLIDAGFAAYPIKECLGFIHNRVGGIGISNLLRMYEKGTFSFSELCKYIIVTRVRPPHMIHVRMADEMKTEMPDLLPLFKRMKEEYGDRYYSPAFTERSYTSENLHKIIAEADVSPSLGSELPPEDFLPGRKFDLLYVTGPKVIYNNILLQLIKRATKVYFDPGCTSYLGEIERNHPKLHHKILQVLCTKEPEQINLIIDFSIESKSEKIVRLRDLQQRFGTDVPVLVNSPVHRLGDLTENALNPSMIFGVYTQRLYLTNTELVSHPLMDPKVYTELKAYFQSFAGTIIEVSDSEVRPLALAMLSKMLEALRLVDEGIADKETVEALGVDDGIFQDIEAIGYRDLKVISDVLRPIYSNMFNLPAGVAERLEHDYMQGDEEA
ncbi:3-hydroxyacyl-CoA dehydrogenase NAD-binding domain-containing protein [Paenibacillus sp. TH7-28]